MNKQSFSSEMSEAEIRRIIGESLPQWRAACDNPDAECVILHRGAFKNSPDELLLMGLAIKYAGFANKTVTICP